MTAHTAAARESVEAHARRPPRDAVRFAPAAVPEPLYLTSRRALPSSTFFTRCAKRSDFSVSAANSGSGDTFVSTRA